MEPGQSGESHSAVTQPLQGVRVLDLSNRIGAYCSKLLADFGADVIKVELPKGDRLRSVPPFHTGPDGEVTGLLYSYYHHNKRGITLDWQRTEAIPLLRELCAVSDVVVASPRGERERLAGYIEDPPSLSWSSGRSLVCFITPFGVTGPYRDWRATPFTSFAMSGHMYPVGPEEGPPVAMPGQQFYDEASTWAAFLIQVVLQGPPTLRSQLIDQSAHEIGLFYEIGQPPFSMGGGIKTRVTNLGPPPSGIWKCRDGWLDVGSHSDRHWDIFVDLVGQPEVLTDPIYRDRHMRIQLFDLLTEIIAELLATRSAVEFIELGQSAGLPCALKQKPAEFVRGDQARERGFFVQSDPAGPHSFEMPGAPFLSAPSLVTHRKAAPRLGEANQQVYVGELGHSSGDIERWRSDALI